MLFFDFSPTELYRASQATTANYSEHRDLVWSSTALDPIALGFGVLGL